jgi:hypothetical protein
MMLYLAGASSEFMSPNNRQTITEYLDLLNLRHKNIVLQLVVWAKNDKISRMFLK